MANGYHAIRTTGTADWRAAPSTRAMAYLSDGSAVFGFMDTNETDITGDGGDSTGISKLYIYHMPADRSAATLKNTITVGVAALNERCETWSISIDANNHLHIAWVVKSDQSIKYIKGTYSAGPSWSMAAAVTVIAAPGTNIFHRRVDIDCISTGDNPVITAFVEDATVTKQIRVAISVKNNSGTWVAATSWVASYQYATAQFNVSVAASQEAAPDASGYHYFAVLVGINTTLSNQGATVRVYQVNLATGAVVTFYTLLGTPSTPTFYRLFYAGSSSNVKSWVVGASYTTAIDASSNARVLYMAAASLDASNLVVDRGSSILNTSPYVSSDASGNVVPCAMTYNPVDKRMAFFWPRSDSKMGGTIAAWDSTANTISIRSGVYIQGDGFTSSAMAYGNPTSRNCNNTTSDTFSSSGYSLNQSRMLMDAGTAVITTPAAGSTLHTNTPTIQPYLNTGLSVNPRQFKAEFQFATDVGFTANVTTFREPDLLGGINRFLQIYNAYGYPYTTETPLTQNTWYCRSRLVDDFGAVGPWQTVSAPYLISHAPAAANLQPGVGSVVMIYGVPTTFSWLFNDPYFQDVQTAYQVVIERVSDSVIVWDSGKVSSSVSSASTTISSTYKDTDLRWKVRVWDGGDVVGAYTTSAATFQVTDAPNAVVTAPSGTITTAIPTITWTNGISSPKTQKTYRVVISVGSVILHDTGWVLGAALSYNLPLGILSNGLSGTVTVYVEDSLGLQDSGSSTFTVSYTLPAVPSGASTGLVYLFEYRNRGFVYVSLDGSGQDADFQSYNLYRRIFGDSAWTLLKSWSLPGVRLVYQDFSAVSGATYEYAVSQTVNRYGDIIESNKATLRTVTPVDDKYWMFSKSDNSKSMPLFGVTDDGYTDEYEQETYNIIGRGRHTDYGDRLGLNGSMTVKLRDRMISGVAKVNYLKAPALAVHTSDNVDPTLWTTGNGGTVGTKTVSYKSGQEPTPCGSLEHVSITASAMGTATTDYVEAVQAISQSDMPMPAATNFVMSVYVGGIPTAVNIVIIFTYYNSSNGVISTSTAVNLSPSEYYLPTPGVGHVDYGLAGQYWARYYQAGTTPTNYDHMTVTVRMRGIGSGTSGLTKALNLSSGQLELGTTPTVYVDGEQLGGQWRGDEDLSSSETTGYYTARQMKQDIEDFKFQREYGYLRTPFGDLYSVAWGNVSLKRLAGVATNEFSDVEIPYTEVGF